MTWKVKNVFLVFGCVWVVSRFLSLYIGFYIQSREGIWSSTFVPTRALSISRYSIETSTDVLPNFEQLYSDETTAKYLEEARLRHSVFKETVAVLLKNVGYPAIDASGIVDRGRMFVFSKEQLSRLFGGTAPSGDLLLDIGAGDGHTTSQIASNFKRVVATELSTVMVKRLRDRGYFATSKVDALDDSAFMGRLAYDLVMMLNIMDRVDTPRTLLRQVKALVKPGSGRVLMAVVLPFCPFVVAAGQRRVPPKETLPMVNGTCKHNATFESSLISLAKNVLTPMGFEIEAWTKLPYLCEGDGRKEFFALDDALLLLKVTGEETSPEQAEPIQPGILKPGGMEELRAKGIIEWVFQTLL